MFNLYRLMIPRGKEWRIKDDDQAKSVKPVEEALRPAKAVKPSDGPVRPVSSEMPPDLASSTPL
jgi:hypothetical protein